MPLDLTPATNTLFLLLLMVYYLARRIVVSGSNSQSALDTAGCHDERLVAVSLILAPLLVCALACLILLGCARPMRGPTQASAPQMPQAPAPITQAASSARLLTLSRDGILALDDRSWNAASIVSEVPSGKGVEYTIAFMRAPASVTVTSSGVRGKGSLVGIPLSSMDSFALRFTLLSPLPNPNALVSVGAVINKQYSGTAYAPVALGGSVHRVDEIWAPSGRKKTRPGVSTVEEELRQAVATTGTDATVTKAVGFTAYIAPYYSNAWPSSGGTVKLLVEPVEKATVLVPR
jgi:hypothetical protein